MITTVSRVVHPQNRHAPPPSPRSLARRGWLRARAGFAARQRLPHGRRRLRCHPARALTPSRGSRRLHPLPPWRSADATTLAKKRTRGRARGAPRPRFFARSVSHRGRAGGHHPIRPGDRVRRLMQRGCPRGPWPTDRRDTERACGLARRASRRAALRSPAARDVPTRVAVAARPDGATVALRPTAASTPLPTGGTPPRSPVGRSARSPSACWLAPCNRPAV